jgi:hypothetical protein
MTAEAAPDWEPADRRHARLREILAQQGTEGATLRQLQAWLSAEGLNVARETLHRWLIADQEAGLVHGHHVPAGLRWFWGKGTGHARTGNSGRNRHD